MKKKRNTELTERQRDDLASSLLRVAPEGEVSSDAAFLAGFRSRLAQVRQGQPATFSLGELSWRLVPVLSAAAALLVGASLLVLQTQPGTTGARGDEVVWSFFSQDASMEIGDELILSAALLEEEEEER